MHFPRELLLLLDKAGLDNTYENRELLHKAISEAIGEVKTKDPLWIRTMSQNKHIVSERKHIARGEEALRIAIKRINDGDKNFEKQIIKLLLSY